MSVKLCAQSVSHNLFINRQSNWVSKGERREKEKADNIQGRLGSRTRHEKPSGQEWKGNGVIQHEGGRHRPSQDLQEIDVFPNYPHDHKNQIVCLWASLKSILGVHVQKFSWCCHNSSACRYNLTTSTAYLADVPPKSCCSVWLFYFNIYMYIFVNHQHL